MQKESFIDLLMRNNPVEINEMIKNKGKKAKPVCPVLFKTKNNDVKEEGNKKNKGGKNNGKM